MAQYVLFSHDGFGLGHVRRNALIGRALKRRDPTCGVTIVTGVAVAPRWLTDPSFRVVTIPPMVKAADGSYRHASLPFEQAIAHRADKFRAVIQTVKPDVVLVDRHPYGIAGELRAGLDLARNGGAHLVVGLRDVLDEPGRIAQELAGAGWAGVEDLFDYGLIYGESVVCDHRVEYGLTLRTHYCGLVAPDAVEPVARHPFELVVAAGGGGDGAITFELGSALLTERPNWRATVLAGPAARSWVLAHPTLGQRITLRHNVDGCAPYFASAAAVVQMAGYNSTAEALRASIRPILVPRRNPRREQAIRASRLAAMGLADVVDAGAHATEVAWLLDRPRVLQAGACEQTGLRLDGAQRAADRLAALATAGARS